MPRIMNPMTDMAPRSDFMLFRSVFVFSVLRASWCLGADGQRLLSQRRER